MNDKSDLLRRRIAHYRHMLREGVEGELAVEYLRSIIEDERALSEIERREEKP